MSGSIVELVTCLIACRDSRNGRAPWLYTVALEFNVRWRNRRANSDVTFVASVVVNEWSLRMWSSNTSHVDAWPPWGGRHFLVDGRRPRPSGWETLSLDSLPLCLVPNCCCWLS